MVDLLTTTLDHELLRSYAATVCGRDDRPIRSETTRSLGHRDFVIRGSALQIREALHHLSDRGIKSLDRDHGVIAIREIERQCLSREV